MSTQTRMTIEIPKEYHRRLKSFAALQGKSMREVIMESLEKHLEEALKECEFSKCGIPNEELEKALKNTESEKNLVRCKNAKDLFKKLGI